MATILPISTPERAVEPPDDEGSEEWKGPKACPLMHAPCWKEKCIFWDTAQKECTFITLFQIRDQLEEISSALSALENFIKGGCGRVHKE